MIYLVLKAAHVICVTVFIGGLVVLMLASASLGSRGRGELDPAARLRAMVRWWDLRVTVPAMVGTWGFGFWIAMSGGWFASGWLQTKLFLVLVISGLHGVLAGRLRRVNDRSVDIPKAPSTTLTAVVLLCIVSIIGLAIVKP